MIKSCVWTSQNPSPGSDETLTQLKVPHALIGGMALSEYTGKAEIDFIITRQPISKSMKRMLTGQAYLKFLREYLALFQPKKVRVKIVGEFLF